jgi:pleiotropic regulator 1
MLGHTNRVNSIVATHSDYILTTSNDCTMRQWNEESGLCIAVFKFADPISVAKLSLDYNMVFTASWDKMIRCVDIEKNKVVKSFIGSKEAIKCLEIVDNYVYVAGCD